MNRDRVIELIKEAMAENTEYELNSDSAITRHVSLYEGFQSTPVVNYDLNLASVDVIDMYHADRGDEGDWGHSTHAVFTFDKGIALVSDVYSSDYTFSHQEFTLDIMETRSWEDFDKAILTNDLRQRFINFTAELAMLR